MHMYILPDARMSSIVYKQYIRIAFILLEICDVRRTCNSPY